MTQGPQGPRPLDILAKNRLRYICKHRGWKLIKSRRQDRLALDYGRYWIMEAATGNLIAPKGRGGQGFTGVEVTRYLMKGRKR